MRYSRFILIVVGFSFIIFTRCSSGTQVHSKIADHDPVFYQPAPGAVVRLLEGIHHRTQFALPLRVFDTGLLPPQYPLKPEGRLTEGECHTYLQEFSDQFGSEVYIAGIQSMDSSGCQVSYIHTSDSGTYQASLVFYNARGIAVGFHPLCMHSQSGDTEISAESHYWAPGYILHIRKESIHTTKYNPDLSIQSITTRKKVLYGRIVPGSRSEINVEHMTIRISGGTMPNITDIHREGVN